MDRKWVVAVASVVVLFALGVGVGLRLARPKPVSATLLFASPPAPSTHTGGQTEAQGGTRPRATPSPSADPEVSGVVVQAPAGGGKYAVVVSDFCDEQRQAGAAELEGCSQPATVYVEPGGAASQTICFASNVKPCQRIRVLSQVEIANAPDAPCPTVSSTPPPETTSQYTSPTSCSSVEAAPWVDTERGMYYLGCNLSKPPSFRFRLCLDEIKTPLPAAAGVFDGR